MLLSTLMLTCYDLMLACCRSCLLVIRQCFHTLYIDGEGLDASQNLMERLNQLLLHRSHIGLLLIQGQGHQTVLILAAKDAAVTHRL